MRFSIISFGLLMVFGVSAADDKPKDIREKWKIDGDFIAKWHPKVPGNGYEKGSAEEYFRHYKEDFENTDVFIDMPDGFEEVNLYDSDWEGYFTAVSYPVGSVADQIFLCAASNDGQAMFPYPFVMLLNHQSCLNYMGKVKNDVVPNRCDLAADLIQYVQVIREDDMSGYSGADFILQYELSLDGPIRPFMDKYEKCIGLYIRKYGHPSLLMKVMLTWDGYENKEKYLKALFNSIRYGNDAKLSELEEVGMDDIAEFFQDKEDYRLKRDPGQEGFRKEWLERMAGFKSGEKNSRL